MPRCYYPSFPVDEFVHAALVCFESRVHHRTPAERGGHCLGSGRSLRTACSEESLARGAIALLHWLHTTMY